MKDVLAASHRRRARVGDCVKIDLSMIPENGYVPESLFDTKGIVNVIIGWGDLLPGLHEMLLGKAVGDSVKDISVDAGWGQRQDDLVLEVPKQKLKQFVDTESLAVGDIIQLKANMQVIVTDITKDTVTVDANHPLAGTSYCCTFSVLQINPLPASFAYRNNILPTTNYPYEFASFSLGCFWGAQIAFDRLHGVIGTRVGYTQGTTETQPTYEEVCQGSTKHRETVLVVYDPAVVSYQRLIRLALERLSITTSTLELHRLFEPHHMQYNHGCYYHSPEQKVIAQRELENNKFGMELLQATTFFEAEEEHQKYLFKWGQSQKKEAKEDIRCFG
jgi:peptide-methionine (S)-S-oxide reductase